MKTRGALALLACGLSGVVQAEIDLTPHDSFRELEGCKFPQVEFYDGATKISYAPPKGWRCLGRDRQTVALIPQGKDLVSAKIKFIPTTGPLVLDAVQLKHLKDTAYQLLPPDGELTIEPVVIPNPLVLNAHATCEIDVQFVLHSQKLRMSVLFVDLGTSQLRFSLISRATDFEPLHKAFQESWYTWQWM